MKKIALVLVALLALLMLVRWCGSGASSVESLYGTYTGTDSFGHKVKIVLKPESANEWKKYGEDWSDNLVYKDSRGKIQDMEMQTITWTWDLDRGYVKTYYRGNTIDGERTIIDIRGKKMYHSWGEYLDKRNGFSYTKH